MTPIVRQFAAFAVVGTMGFVVDTTLLYAATRWFDLNLYSGRLVSYIGAATFTWAANRTFTFRDRSRTSPGRQWLKFVAINAIGGAINYGVYAAAVASMPIVARWPVLGVAAGSFAGLSFNFAASRNWVFKAAP